MCEKWLLNGYKNSYRQNKIRHVWLWKIITCIFTIFWLFMGKIMNEYNINIKIMFTLSCQFGDYIVGRSALNSYKGNNLLISTDISLLIKPFTFMSTFALAFLWFTRVRIKEASCSLSDSSFSWSTSSQRDVGLDPMKVAKWGGKTRVLCSHGVIDKTFKQIMVLFNRMVFNSTVWLTKWWLFTETEWSLVTWQ